MAELHSTIEHVNGFRSAGVHCGIKKNGALDFALIVADVPCTAAGVFTTNQVKAAPVLLNQEHLAQSGGRVRAIVMNSGVANACTGAQGMANARETARYVAARIGCAEHEVLVLSTGVIGVQLPMEKIKHGVDLALASLGDAWESTARAIMTTDTKPKLTSITTGLTAGQTAYTVAGMSKGAGMIAPNMATMLGILLTDASLDVADAQTLLKSTVDESFNRITVDGDMSTNDTVLFLASGQSDTPLEMPENRVKFQFTLDEVGAYLAKAIVLDAEGATKFVRIRVTGAPDNAAARRIADTIGTSPLVKTAFFGSDPNWGRIIAAAGRAGVALNPDAMQLWIATQAADAQPLQLFRDGMGADYQETDAAAIMANAAIMVTLQCGDGNGSAEVWTCDLSHDYVSINADYRT